MNKYSGVVVWFNPDEEVIENIKSYIQEIERLYIIDNSNKDNSFLLSGCECQKKCEYISLGENKGLAYALNIGCDKAIEDGFEYILTMDQDSCFEDNAVDILKKVNEEENNKYAIICPNIKSVYYENGEKKTAYYTCKKDEKVMPNWVITSGSLMNASVYQKVKGFDDEMFIAHLDVELGIKIFQANEKILMVGSAILEQRFGNSAPKKILWKTVYPSYDKPVRSYYMVRNQIHLEKKYGKEIRSFIGCYIWKKFVKTMLFEDEKKEKCLMMIRGYCDGKQGRMGAYREQK